MNHEPFIVPPGKKIRLEDYDPGYTGEFENKDEALLKLQEDVRRLAEYQDVLYAQNTRALLVIFQAMDAAGKDSVIKHVMSGVNPQGCQVFSFKTPSTEELDHDYLWRTQKALPERGRIGIFNRSYYEEVLMPPEARGDDIWQRRFKQINHFERYLVENGIAVLKFFLHVSKAEQKSRFLKRIMTPEKNWKFSLTDVKERGFWEQYMAAYEDMFNHTSTEHAPWYVVPADHKWFTRAAVADVIIAKLQSLHLSYPTVSEEHRQELLKAKEVLENEDRER
jgi:PPK2 family polyphosphate:nucleotide phosphotransferase